jgi:uncharacterized membrane protein
MLEPSPYGVRTRRERLIQTLCFEALGVLLVAPLFARAARFPADQSALVLVALSAAMLGWSALFNTVCDVVEYRLAHRLASDRPHALRVLHAAALEATATLVTWPLILALTPLGLLEALFADLGLAVAYAVYGYFFHLAFDHLRPVPVRAPQRRS